MTIPLLTFSKFAALHSVSPKTVDRWVARGVLPQPTYIRGRKYFPANTIPQQGERPPRGLRTAGVMEGNHHG
jgi:predicted site-specific integrase-resolvase